MKRQRLHAPRIALELSAWRTLDECAPGAMAFAVPGKHSSAPDHEAPEYPSGQPIEPIGGGTVGEIHANPHLAAHGAGFPGEDPFGFRPQPVEYRVGIRLTNISGAPFRFDLMVLEISPSTGVGGTFRNTTKDGGTGPAKTRLIRVGETLVEIVGTTSYTGDLVRDSGGQPLRLNLALLLRGRAVETWSARLPDLAELPRFDPDHFSPHEEIPQGSRRLHVPSLSDN